MKGVTNDGWKYIDGDLIIACGKYHLELISLMRRITFVVEYVIAVT